MEKRIDQFISDIFKTIVYVKGTYSYYAAPEYFVITYSQRDIPDLFTYRPLDIIHNVVEAAGYKINEHHEINGYSTLEIYFGRRSF